MLDLEFISFGNDVEFVISLTKSLSGLWVKEWFNNFNLGVVPNYSTTQGSASGNIDRWIVIDCTSATKSDLNKIWTGYNY